MSVLLSVAPYAVALVTYLATARQVFDSRRPSPPANWAWLLVAPVAIGGLTPLALASKEGLNASGRNLLLSAVALAVVFVVLVLSLLNSDGRFRWLERTVSIGHEREMRLRWRHLLVTLGSAIVIFGAAVNVVVGSKSSCRPASHALRA